MSDEARSERPCPIRLAPGAGWLDSIVAYLQTALEQVVTIADDLAAYDHALALDPNNPWNWNGKSYALESIETAVSLAPDVVNAYDSECLRNLPRMSFASSGRG